MKVTAASASVAILLALCCSYGVTTITALNLTVTNRVCTGVTYDPATDPYQNSVDYVLNDLLTVTANTPGFNYFTHSPDAGNNIPIAYGHAFCTPTLSVADCVTCMLAVTRQNRDDCNSHIGGLTSLVDCTIVYGNAPV